MTPSLVSTSRPHSATCRCVQRDALVLHHLVGLAVTEVASELGVPEGTVKAWLSRGRRRLAAALAERTGRSRGAGAVPTAGEDQVPGALREVATWAESQVEPAAVESVWRGGARRRARRRGGVAVLVAGVGVAVIAAWRCNQRTGPGSSAGPEV